MSTRKNCVLNEELFHQYREAGKSKKVEIQSNLFRSLHTCTQFNRNCMVMAALRCN